MPARLDCHEAYTDIWRPSSGNSLRKVALAQLIYGFGGIAFEIFT